VNFKVKAIPKFESELKKLVKKYPSLKMEFFELFNSLKINPSQGTSLGNIATKYDFLLLPKEKVNPVEAG